MVKTNSIKAWFLASRPKTLTGAAAPVFVGAAMAWNRFIIDDTNAGSLPSMDSILRRFCLPFTLCLLFAFLMQIAANFVNDYYDFKKGTDREDRLGPERACSQGWITPRAMLIGTIICIAIACTIGLVILSLNMQWELLAVGIACVAGCLLYTTKFSYLGLGDILVLVFFGLIPVGFTYYVLTDGDWNLSVTLAGLGMGLATDNLLMVNNYRDRYQDEISGKKTIVVRIGGDFGLRCYLWLGIIATIFAYATIYFLKSGSIIPLVVYVVLHIQTWQTMSRLDGKALNGVLGKTARNIFLYGLLLAISVLL